MEAIQEAMDLEAEVVTLATSESGDIGALVIEDEDYEDKGGNLYLNYCSNRDARLFKELVDLYHSRIFYYIFRKVGDIHTAEDLIQEVWIKLAQANSYDSNRNFYSWCGSIVQHVIIDYFRLKQTQMRYKTEFISVLEADSGFTPPSTPDPSLAIENREAAIAELSILSDTLRRTLLLHYFDDLSINEIAEIEKVTPDAIDHRLTTARNSVRSKCRIMAH